MSGFNVSPTSTQSLGDNAGRPGVAKQVAKAVANKRAKQLMKRGSISQQAYNRTGAVKDDAIEASSR